MKNIKPKSSLIFSLLIKLLIIIPLIACMSGCESVVSFNKIGYLPQDYKSIVESAVRTQLTNPDSAKFEYPIIPRPGIIENQKFQTYSGWIGIVRVHGKSRDGIAGKSTFQFCISQGKITKLDNASSDAWRYKADDAESRWQYLVKDF